MVYNKGGGGYDMMKVEKKGIKEGEDETIKLMVGWLCSEK